ncbi:MAG: hypothetical protein LBQ94_11110 [Treponema sp.]|nr:hypothetical protein [Treponema sp.]
MAQIVYDQITEWAFTLLRPVLKQLDVQKLKKEPRIVRASEHDGLKAAGMGRWVIFAQQAAFQEEERGCVSITFDTARKLFYLTINVDEKLYASNDLELRTQRKIIAIHELVHGFSYMYTSTFLPLDSFVETVNQSMNAKVKMTTSEEFEKILSIIRQPGVKRSGLLPDGHYRLVVDGFRGNYGELCMNLLLSYQLISEFMTTIKQQHKKTGINFTTLLGRTISELVEQKALEKELVLGRMALFFPRLYDDFG